MEIIHTVEREIDIPSWIVIENHLDLDHIPHVHKRCYKYASIITRYQRKDGYHVMLLELGAKPFTPLPLVINYTMFHQFIPPNKIIHYSKPKNSKRWTKCEITFYKKGDGKTVEIHNHILNLPIIFFPFKKWIIKIIRRWSDILWEEDSQIMRDRHEAVSKGFKDGLHCGKWTFKDGKTKFVFDDSAKEENKISDTHFYQKDDKRNYRSSGNPWFFDSEIPPYNK